MTLAPEGIAAVIVVAVILGILAMVSSGRRGKEGTGRCTGDWRPSAAHGTVEPPLQQRPGDGSYTGTARAPRPTITERQAREYRAASERFPGYAPSEIKQSNRIR